MASITFDTHAFIKKLKDSGFQENQAEAISEAIKEVQESHLGELASKQDIKDVKQDMKEMELRINAQLMLLKWMTGLMLAGVASLVIKTFFGS